MLNFLQNSKNSSPPTSSYLSVYFDLRLLLSIVLIFSSIFPVFSLNSCAPVLLLISFYIPFTSISDFKYHSFASHLCSSVSFFSYKSETAFLSSNTSCSPFFPSSSLLSSSSVCSPFFTSSAIFTLICFSFLICSLSCDISTSVSVDRF